MKEIERLKDKWELTIMREYDDMLHKLGLRVTRIPAIFGAVWDQVLDEIMKEE